MTFTAPKPGGHSTGERLTATQFNVVNTALPDAIDGGAGGTYAPSAAIVIGGSGLETTVTPSGGNDVTNKTYVDRIFHGCSVGFSDSSPADGSPFAVSFATDEKTGFDYSITSDAVEVPEAGFYLVVTALQVRTSDTTAGATVAATLKRGASSIRALRGYRHGTDTGIPAILANAQIVEITTPSTERISWVRNDATYTLTNITFSSATISRIG